MSISSHLERLGARRRFMATCLVATGSLSLGMPRLAAAAGSDSPVDERRLAAAVAGAIRRPADTARDPARHPFETLRFFGVAPDMTVIEVAPGGGWYTDILASYLYERGRLYAAHYSPTAGSDYTRNSRARFDAKLASNRKAYGRIVVGEQPGAGHGFRGIAPRGGADRILTFRNLHNWMAAGYLDDCLRAFHAALRPGGVLGVVEHRAAPGTAVATMIDSGYMSEAFVIERARAAGFVLDASSEINANPKDTKDYPHGVWSLPPTLRGKDQDRDRLVAIGESDRMTLRFRRA